MAIEKIDADLCNGCGICVNTCQNDVIRMDDKQKKAIIKYPEDCETRRCSICELHCPEHAIYISPTKHTIPLTSFGV